MKTFSKALVGTLAAGAVAASSATPALARDFHNGNGNGISAGEVIAGALVIGGIAAVAAAASDKDRDHYGYGERDYRYDRAGYRGGYGDYGRGGYDMNPRQAVEQCVRAAERDAARYSYGKADVTDIRNVRETRNGFEVKGRIAVNANRNGWHRGDGDYGRGWGGDYRGWNSSMRGYDSGSFTCKVEYGRVSYLNFSGLRNL